MIEKYQLPVLIPDQKEKASSLSTKNKGKTTSKQQKIHGTELIYLIDQNP